MHCTNCGAVVEASATFCTKCGSRLSEAAAGGGASGPGPSRFGALWAGLVSELDSARDGWVSLVGDVMSSSEGGLSLVNREFSESADVGSFDGHGPECFVFETLNGVSAEATVIAWQIQSSLGFATSQNYISEDDGQEWLMVLAKSLSPTSHPRWILAMQAVLASFQKGVMIDDGDMATVLAHFFMNESRFTAGVRQACEKLPGLITFLQGFTYLGTARTFGDQETVASIQKTLGLEASARGDSATRSAVRTEATEHPESKGFGTVRELALASQLVFLSPGVDDKDESRRTLRAIGDLALNAPFPVRSAFIEWRGAERLRTQRNYDFVKGEFYDEPLGPDGVPQITSARSHRLVFWKDLRTRFLSKQPVDPAAYDRWQVSSEEKFEELKKELSFKGPE